MENLLALIILGSVSLGSVADDRFEVDSRVEQSAYHVIEIDKAALNQNLIAKLDSERDQLLVEMNAELNNRIDGLFGKE